MTVTVSIDDSVVATLSGSRFSGNITVAGTGSFEQGISGSLTRLTDGTSYLVAGTNVTITSASNGQVEIAATATEGGAPTDAQYVVLSNNASLSAERVLTPGQDLLLTDAGAGNAATLSFSRVQMSSEIMKRLAAIRYAVIGSYTSGGTYYFCENNINFSEFGASFSVPALSTSNLMTRSTRGLVTSAATANTRVGFSETSSLTYRQDGFWLIVKFGFNAWAAANRQFFCGATTSFAISSTNQPTALTDMVGVGMDSGDTQLYIMHNDSSGTATKVATGITASTTSFYMLIVMCDAGGDIKCIFRDMDSGTETSSTLTTNLPTLSTGLQCGVVWCNGATATAVGGVLNSIIINNTSEINGVTNL